MMKKANLLLVLICAVCIIRLNAQTPNYGSQFGNNILLNGSTDYIRTTYSQNYTAAFTLEAWIKIPSLPGTGGGPVTAYRIFSKGAYFGDISQFPVLMDVGANASILVYLSKGNDFTPDLVLTSPPLSFNVWHHIALTYQSNTSAALYIDGVLISSSPINFTINTNATTWAFGRASVESGGGIGGTYFKGKMDEVRIWNVARTESQILATMNSQLTGNETGLVGYWDMNRNGQGTNLTVTNKATATGAAFNGTTLGITSLTPVFTVNEFCNNPVPTITASGLLTFCAGGSVTLTSSSSTGTHLWSNGATSQSITVNNSGTFTVTNTDVNGCVSPTSAAIDVTVNSIPAPPTINANGVSPLCGNATITLTSSAATGNNWTLQNSNTTLANTQNYVVSAANAGVNTTSNFVVTTTDNNGCTSATSAPFTVTILPIPETPTITPDGPATFCQGDSVTLTSSASSGNFWSNGQSSQSISVTTAGSFTVTQTVSGCTSLPSDEISVTIIPSTTYFADTDSDGYGDLLSSIQACELLQGYVTNSLDCNDSDSSIHPGSVEYLNGIDDNCDGQVDNNALCHEAGLIFSRTTGSNQNEYIYAIEKTNDGGFIIAGKQDNITGLVVKFDSSGRHIQWQKQLNYGSYESFNDIKQTSDGGYLIVGYVRNLYGLFGENSSDDLLLVKLDATGNIQFVRKIGDQYFEERGNSLTLTGDGGCIVAGTKSDYPNSGGNTAPSQFYIIKFGVNGNIQWQQSFGGPSDDIPNSIKQTPDGAYIIAGRSFANGGDVTGNHGSSDYWIIKISASGSLLWQKSLGGSGWDEAFSISTTIDGGYIVAGKSTSNNGDVTGYHGSYDYWIVKLNETGIIQWQKSLGGSGNDVATAIMQTTEGNYIVAGNSTSNNGDVTGNHGSADYWVVKLKETGALDWQKSLGGSGGEFASDVEIDDDETYIIAGHTTSVNGDVLTNFGSSDGWIVKLSGPNPTRFYIDADGDDYGNPATSVLACEKPNGYTTNGSDCDDSRSTVYPGATEICNNGIDENCNGMADDFTAQPIIGEIVGITNVCSYVNTGNAVVLRIPSLAGALSYVWSVPPSVTIQSGQGTNTIQILISNDFVTSANKRISVYAITTCMTSNIVYKDLLAATPSTPGGINASSTDICSVLGSNSAITYKIDKVSGASGYIWEMPAGASGMNHPAGIGVNDTIVEITFSSSFTSGNLNVSATNNCGSSSTRSLSITRNSVLTPSLIIGPKNACQYIGPFSAFATYTTSAIGATAFNWTLPLNVTNVTGQGTNSISFKYPIGFTSGTISVTATNGCGTSSPRSLSISTLNPSSPGVIDVIQLGSCPFRRFSYSVAALPANAVSLEWIVPAGSVIVSGQGTTSIVVDYPPSQVNGSVMVRSISNCRNSSYRLQNVKLIACPVSFTGKNSSANYSKIQPETYSSDNFNVQLYPNPTTAEFQLRVNNLNKEFMDVKIMDVTGKSIKLLKMQTNETIKLGSALPSGVYFIEILLNNKRTIRRLVKY